MSEQADRAFTSNALLLRFHTLSLSIAVLVVSADNEFVRWINRVDIDMIRFRLLLPT